MHQLPLELRLQILSLVPISDLLHILTCPISKQVNTDIQALFHTHRKDLLAQVIHRLRGLHDDAFDAYVTCSSDHQLRVMVTIIHLLKFINTESDIKLVVHKVQKSLRKCHESGLYSEDITKLLYPRDASTAL